MTGENLLMIEKKMETVRDGEILEQGLLVDDGTRLLLVEEIVVVEQHKVIICHIFCIDRNQGWIIL